MCNAKRSHLPSKITTKVRASQFPDVLHESGGKLFCTHCNIVVEHKQKSSLDKHFSTAKHARRMAETQRGQKRQWSKTKTKVTMTEAVASTTIIGFATCTAVNIPLYKSDHPAMRRFLKEKVLNGGAIPGFHQLQEKYFGAVYQKEKDELKTHLAQKPVAVIFDETPDVEGRCVLNILIASLEKDESGRILTTLQTLSS
uniref:CGG triplet repeat-binding protein 1 n=1 Tax=Sphaeramia orbicularis TaxID=375764 RepID=A0A673CCE3_9TELE